MFPSGAAASVLHLCLASLLGSAGADVHSATATVDSDLLYDAFGHSAADALSLLQVGFFNPLSPEHGFGIVDELEPEISEVSSELYHSSTGSLIGSVADEYADAAIVQAPSSPGLASGASVEPLLLQKSAVVLTHRGSKHPVETVVAEVPVASTTLPVVAVTAAADTSAVPFMTAGPQSYHVDGSIFPASLWTAAEIVALLSSGVLMLFYWLRPRAMQRWHSVMNVEVLLPLKSAQDAPSDGPSLRVRACTWNLDGIPEKTLHGRSTRALLMEWLGQDAGPAGPMDATTSEPTADVYAICLQGTSAVARERLRKEVQGLLGADFRLVCAEDTGDAEGPSLGSLATSVHVRREFLEGPRAGKDARLRLGLANVNLPARRCPARGKGHPHFLYEVTEALADAAGPAESLGHSDLTLVLGDLSLDGAEATRAAAHVEQASIVAQQPVLPPEGASAACVEFSSDFRVQGFEEGYGTDASGRDRVIYKALNGTTVRAGAYVACRPETHEIWHTCHRPVSQVLDVAPSR